MSTSTCKHISQLLIVHTVTICPNRNVEIQIQLYLSNPES